MDRELDEKLVKAFPNLYMDRNGNMSTTCMCWGFSCGKGWFDLIWKLSEKLEPLCKAVNDSYTEEQKKLGCRCCASQVKEKFGTLRFYMTCETDEISKLINEAETKSATICETCGKKGKTRNDIGWVRTLCQKHYLHLKQPKRKLIC